LPRYFLEISYTGTAYSGIASQPNGITIQDKIEEILNILFKQKIATSTSSRTDAGVHAKQNFLHFDADYLPDNLCYKCNAMLPQDIAILNCYEVKNDAHSRFDAISRMYNYTITLEKNPFLAETSWQYPYPIDLELLHKASEILMQYTDFKSFCKKHSDNYTTICQIKQSSWTVNNKILTYTVEANRFLRGMVRGLVATQMMVAKGKISLADFNEIIALKDCTKAFFDAPAKGLRLESVNY
jgi:tRNA pseudouridine38-40 synthase